MNISPNYAIWRVIFPLLRTMVTRERFGYNGLAENPPESVQVPTLPWQKMVSSGYVERRHKDLRGCSDDKFITLRAVGSRIPTANMFAKRHGIMVGKTHKPVLFSFVICFQIHFQEASSHMKYD